VAPESVPFLWTGAWKVNESDAGPELRAIRDLMEAHGEPEGSASFRDSVEAAARGAIRQTGLMLLTTEEDFRWHFACYHRIAVSIAGEGFLDIDELGPGSPPGRNPELGVANPGISLDPNGHAHWSGDGRHRVAIARWLGLRSIPVVVRSVDLSWMRSTMARDERSVAATIADRLGTLRPPDEFAHGRSKEWLDSLATTDTAPGLHVRPDPDRTNAAVARALRFHREQRWSEAGAAWASAGAGDGAPHHVDVMAARTAFAARDLAAADRLTAGVLAVRPDHLAAGELAARMRG